MPEEIIDTKDQPLTETWGGDWARAVAQADAYEENPDAGDTREDERPSGASEDSTPAADAGGGEGDVETDASAQPGGESTGGQESDDGQRDASQPGRVRRERVPEAVDDEALTAFKEKAEELGYTFDNRQVTSQERVSLRQERREMRQKLAAERQEVETILKQRVTEMESSHGKATALQKAVDGDDLDAVATALGFKDWADVNQSYLNKTLSPEHKEISALKKQMKAHEDRETKRVTDAKSAHEQETRTAKEKEYLADLSDDVGDLAESHLAAFAKDPAFVSGVLAYQKQHWDGVETISTKDAAELAYKDAQGLFNQLSKYFGSQETVTPETPASGATTEKATRRRAPKTVSQREAADASQIDDDGDFDEGAWLKKHTKLIDESNRRGLVT